MTRSDTAVLDRLALTPFAREFLLAPNNDTDDAIRAELFGLQR